jgi:cell wall-associated NlpC family hydrolase
MATFMGFLQECGGRVPSRSVRYLSLVLPFVLAACASAARAPAPTDVSDAAAAQAAGLALKMVGKPYRYGGAAPSGFDCSGLVYFSYRQAGVELPHSTDRQRETSRSIHRASVRRGDLVFFDLEGKKNSHVGIYLGDGRFVHAPSSGKHVRTDRLDTPFWKKHFSEARRPSA